MDLNEPLPFITLTDDDCFAISPKASEYLRSLEGEVSIVAIAGLYRTGKSYLLNQLLGRTTEHTMFGVGGTVNAMTKGIWIWGQPVGDAHGKKTIVFMDTEGLGSAQRSQTQDTRIFALALLLSSFFIYNSRGVIDANAIDDLSLVVNLTKYIQVSANPSSSSSSLADFFPSFLWVVRDFTLQLEESGRAISSKEYLENALKPAQGTSDDTVHKNQVRNLLTNFFPARDCITMVRPLNDEALLRDLPKQPFESLRSEFRTQLAALKTRVFTELQPKTLMSKPLNGAMLVTLAQNYVDAFNSGAAPVISSAWDRVVQAQSEQLLDAAKRAFDASLPMPWTSVLTDDQLAEVFRAAETKAIDALHATAVAPDTVPLNLPLLHDWLEAKRRAAWESNDKLAKQHLIKELQELYAPITAQVWTPMDASSYDVVIDALRAKLDGFDHLLKRFIAEYLDRTHGLPSQHLMLCSFLAEKVMDGVVNWGTLVTVLFRQQDSNMQKSISSSRQKVKAVEGRAKAAQEMLQQQKDTFERALQGVTDRLAEDKLNLRADMDHKDGEIKRTLMQIDRIGALHTEVLDGLMDELKTAKEELKAADAMVDAARREQDTVAQDSAKQRLENERRQHAKEQALLEGHHQLLQNVVTLERALGDQQAEHMTAVFKMEQTCHATVRREIDACDQVAAELKAHTIADIRHLKTKQEGELRALTTELDDRQAVLSAMQERLEMQRRVGMTPAAKRGGGKDDCIVS
ncbi:hypothetical protein DYB25_003776 [Aphanomyces astaci]|uniref:GB1/RHD3-type G domain-containing protein n=2 Tax=Aphanomyces astaci TaxID=112090 RepID=A0A397BM88_APHAT|nr:hypothetical protein DYB25_003776 [Aphanomyces astaci]RHY58908.1 hypothetical protein DYB34_000748 [Aphanomyces astaci]RHY58974.1 hypothetical protein DYB38_002728 [Aphanomyces astaci]RHY69408.1 hypothetical protein DYB30_008675 [Aphanomyces astaci]